MIKKVAIYNGIFIVLLATICHYLFSQYGFNPTDEGFVLSTSNRLLHGQIPHVDFSSVRPVGYAFLHIPELLISKNHVYLISRYVFWFEQVCIAFLWVRFILCYSKIRISIIQKYILVVIVFFLNVHYFPASVLHTIDGLLMCVIGLSIIISQNKYSLIGFFIIGFAALCKQNFILFLPIAIILLGRKNWLNNILIGILPIVLYICVISMFGGFYQLKAQLTTHHEFFSIGISTYIKSRLFFAGILFACSLLIIQNNIYKTFVLLVIYLICMYAMVTNRYHEKFGCFIIGATIGYFIITLVKREPTFTKLLFITIVLAWCVSISVGYNTPALFLGGNILLLLLYTINIHQIDIKKFTTYLLIIFIPLVIVFYFVRTHNIYRDAPSSQLTYKLDNIVEGAYGIETNRNTFKVLVELDLLKKLYPNLVVLPDFTACNILHSHQSKIRTEWPNKTEIPNDEILQFVIKDLKKDTSIIAIPKYNLTLFSIGFEAVPKEKVNDFLILNYVFSHYKKTLDYSYFEIYKK